jgi:hypothetical protein
MFNVGWRVPREVEKERLGNRLEREVPTCRQRQGRTEALFTGAG